MTSLRNLFLSQVGQTNERPLLLEVDHARGVFVYSIEGKRYYDMNSGISVSSLGHCHPEIIEAINMQVNKHMHTMVYGEHVQVPQVNFARFLLEQLDENFESIYYLMSGTEATELAMKLAKKVTGRPNIIACKNAYHGSTQGAESLRSDLKYKIPFYPLLPGIKHIPFNDLTSLNQIGNDTACVITEVIQGEAGVQRADQVFLRGLAQKCKEVGALLVCDEIQSGFGRTGRLFAYQAYNCSPDILLVGKAMGGGMPIAGVISSKEILNSLLKNPSLGHITTFGGHPVSCAAAYASLEILLRDGYVQQVEEKEAYIKEKLQQHPVIKEVRSAGLMMAVEPTKRKYLKHIVAHAFELGVLIDWFLFNDRSFRLAPPLVISMSELAEACTLLLKAFDFAQNQYD